MRERTLCLIPWLGIILKDFTFIKEQQQQQQQQQQQHQHQQQNTKLVNLSLAICLRKLLNSMKAAKESCEQFLNESEQEDLMKAALMRKWLENVEILYETEESQYEQSLKL